MILLFFMTGKVLELLEELMYLPKKFIGMMKEI